MRRTLKSLLLAALLTQSGMVLAQEATDAAPADDLSTAIGDLSMGEPVEPQVGQQYVRQEFGDWEDRARSNFTEQYRL